MATPKLSNLERQEFVTRVIETGNFLVLACKISELPNGYVGSLLEMERIKPQIAPMNKILKMYDWGLLDDTFIIWPRGDSATQAIVPLIHAGGLRSTEIFDHERFRDWMTALASVGYSIRESRLATPDMGKIAGWKRDFERTGLTKGWNLRFKDLAIETIKNPPKDFLIPVDSGELYAPVFPRAEDVLPPAKKKKLSRLSSGTVTDILHSHGVIGLSAGVYVEIPTGQKASDFHLGDCVQFDDSRRDRKIRLRCLRTNGTIKISGSALPVLPPIEDDDATT